jgi:hypothetical protein
MVQQLLNPIEKICYRLVQQILSFLSEMLQINLVEPYSNSVQMSN